MVGEAARCDKISLVVSFPSFPCAGALPFSQTVPWTKRKWLEGGSVLGGVLITAEPAIGDERLAVFETGWVAANSYLTYVYNGLPVMFDKYGRSIYAWE